MGTRFRIVLYAPDAEIARGAAQAAFARIAELEDAMSDYREESELMRLCRRAGGPPVRVGDDLFRILRISRDWAAAADGAFDPTAGPVIRLWRRARRTRELPAKGDLRAARALTGWRRMHLDPVAQTVRLERAGMQLDLGGIAKGFAADEALRRLAQAGLERALVVAGGDIVAGEAPPGEAGWKIGVLPFAANGGPTADQLVLRRAAVSTSGDAEQFVEIGGVRYSHIVDPRTGLGVAGRSSVTVRAPDGTTSDAAATALSVLGPARGLRWLDGGNARTANLAALFLQQTPQGPRRFESNRWRAP